MDIRSEIQAMLERLQAVASEVNERMVALVERNPPAESSDRDELKELTDQYRTVMLVIDELSRAFNAIQ